MLNRRSSWSPAGCSLQSSILGLKSRLSLRELTRELLHVVTVGRILGLYEVRRVGSLTELWQTFFDRFITFRHGPIISLRILYLSYCGR